MDKLQLVNRFVVSTQAFKVHMNPELIQAYRRTTFVAATPRGKLQLRIGESHSQLDALLHDYNAEHWAYVTAWNPASEPRTQSENNTRQSELEKELTDASYSLFPGEGVPDEGDWEPEKSVLVIGISRKDAVRYGIKYGQNAIVCGHVGEAAELVSCVDDEQMTSA